MTSGRGRIGATGLDCPRCGQPISLERELKDRRQARPEPTDGQVVMAGPRLAPPPLVAPETELGAGEQS